MRTLTIEVDCGKETCDECERLIGGAPHQIPHCTLYLNDGEDVWLNRDSDGRPLRLRECWHAEVRPEPEVSEPEPPSAPSFADIYED